MLKISPCDWYVHNKFFKTTIKYIHSAKTVSQNNFAIGKNNIVSTESKQSQNNVVGL